MSYMQMAQLDVFHLLKGINTENDYVDFCNMLAHSLLQILPSKNLYHKVWINILTVQ